MQPATTDLHRPAPRYQPQDPALHPASSEVIPVAPPCWVTGSSSRIVFAAGNGRLYHFDFDARTWSEAGRAPGFVLGLAVDGRGRLAVCSGEALCVYDGAVTTVRDGFTQPNYPAFAPDGTLYLSDSGHWGRDDGLVYLLGADGTLEVFSDRLPHFPNGCAVSPDGRYLWMVESYSPALSRIDLATGEPEEVTRLPGTVPDGVARHVEIVPVEHHHRAVKRIIW